MTNGAGLRPRPSFLANKEFTMRRRLQEIMRQQDQDTYTGLPPMKMLEPIKSVPKGYCSKCGKHIGRGVHFHEKACKA